MNAPKTSVLLLLAATTIGGAVLAWRQHNELTELRAAALNKNERAELQKRLWDLEKKNRELQGELAGNRNPASRTAVVSADPSAEPRPNGERGPGRFDRGQQQFNAVRDLLAKPEVQAMINVQQKAAIDSRYTPLFQALSLPTEQIEKLKSLLAERSSTMQDVIMAAAEQGINPRDNPEGFRKLFIDAQNDINASIRATIGDAGFQQLSNYEQTMPQRGIVSELQQRLSYTNMPLTSAQAEQMVQILAANSPQRTANPQNGAPPGGRQADRGPGNPAGGPPPGGPRGPPPDLGNMLAGALGSIPGMGMMVGGQPDGGRVGPVMVTPAAIAQAQTVLAPPQVAALQQIQQQQVTQQQLRQLVNDTLGPNQPPGSDSRGGTPPPGRKGDGKE